MITLNGLRVIGVRLLVPWRGAWLADVTLDVDDPAFAPSSGPGVLLIGATAFTGTVDPRGSGTFGNRATARVVGGGGGWDQVLSGRQFVAPGVTSTVYAATAAEAKEPPVSDPDPQPIEESYVRVAGPARDVFGDRDWHVDPATGGAIVAPWTSTPLDATSTTLVDLDVATQRATLKGDSPIFPGTVLADPRLGTTTLTVRDVEMIFDADGMTCEAWCATSATSRLVDALTHAVRAFGGTRYLRTYRYRVVASPAPGAPVILQGITDGAPDLNPLDQWAGTSGVGAMLQPGSELVVGFNDPTDPYVVSYAPLGAPIQLLVNAPLTTFVGAIVCGAITAGAITATGFAGGGLVTTPAGVQLDGGLTPLVPAPWATSLVTALAAFATAAAGVPGMAAACAALGTALGMLPASATTKTKAT